ncbi:MAG: hypothetical protein RL223_2208 [Pseudomonadota bacterium]|jgi:tripartite-type tricarboxylate transporter receptor subunit TctC
MSLRRTVFAVLLGGLCLPALAAFPEKPLTLVVPYVPGSPADVVARALGDGLAKRLGQAVVVENRAGGNTQIGTAFTARAPADGHTLMLGNMDSHALNPLLSRQLPYDTERDFAPVVLVSRPTTVLVASPGGRVRNAAELLAVAKAQPDQLSYGSWGQGSVAHLWGALLEQTAGIRLYHVPFQGTPAALQALMGNQIDLMFAPPAVALAQAQAGKLRIIGSTAAQRLPQYPELPTLAEQGFRGFEGVTWFGVYAPARTPPELLERLNRELNAVLQSAEAQARLASLSMSAVGGSREALATQQRESRLLWSKLIADRGIKLDD